MVASPRSRTLASALCAAALLAAAAAAVRPPAESPAFSLLFRAAELGVRSELVKASDEAAGVEAEALEALGAPATAADVDLTTGRFASLRLATPLVPGRGAGNRLAWPGAAPGDAQALEAAVWEAFWGYLQRHAADLRIDPAELVLPGHVSATSEDMVRIWIQRRVDGHPVRDSRIVATVKYGNLILLGVEGWGDVDRAAASVRLDPVDAEQALRRFVTPDLFGKTGKGMDLVWTPTTSEQGVLSYRLAWVFENDLGRPGGRYEAVVDAATGELLALEDRIQWVASRREVVGGVYPVSNDQVAPDGVEQTGWPMPFTTVTVGGNQYTTDIGGNLPVCADGSISAALTGPLVRTVDSCGASSLASTGNLDWSSGPLPASTDCTTPGVGGAGNTKSSRSGFHELNMLKIMGRSQLPANGWIPGQLNANMNLNDVCNAFWDGTAVNFFLSAVGFGCGNTGEIAAIFDHEWGHGLDDNDAVPGIASPGEAIADIYASLRLDTSCIGRGFNLFGPCDGYGDACDSCTGVRDIDYLGHASNQPALIGGTGGVMNNCPATGSRGPCNKEVHCEGMAPAEAVWDLWNRELTSAPYNFSLDKAREIGAQLSFRGGTGITSWYACDTTAPYDGGCGGGGGYKQYLAADDDDGNLINGTPHWVAIDDAFTSHRVGCESDSPVDSGCAGAPAGVPTVTATPRNQGVDLSWTGVGGASVYRVYRTDGVFGCDFGKILVATVAGTSYRDRGLQNGRLYSYLVLPMGAADECFGAPSACTQATPALGPSVSPVATTALFSAYGGDGDTFVDACEVGRVNFRVSNNGSASLTNVRIVAASSPSHPATVISTALPKTVAAALAPCAEGYGQLEFIAPTLTENETFELELVVTADELAGGTETMRVATDATEGDFQFNASKTFSFESGTEGWGTVAGTFVRASAIAGPPGGGTFYYQSSAGLAGQCDVVRSPRIRVQAGSTMSLQNHYNIEPLSDIWYDRANIGLVDLATGVRTPISPDGGRLYNASGSAGTCGTTGQAGWAGNFSSWAASSWTSGALQAATFAGKPAQLEVRYGTDPGVHPDGFRFDLVTLTNVEVQVADAQTDSCAPTPAYLFADSFEVGSTAEWSATTTF